MAVKNVVHVNECGLPLNAVEWLVTHHESKVAERTQMIRDLQLREGGLVVDAGCGPGLWTPLLAEAIGLSGRIIGVDISLEALVTAQRRCHRAPYRRQVQYKRASLDQLPLEAGCADAIFSANVSQYLADPVGTFAAMGRYLMTGGRLIIKDIDFGTLRFSYVDPDLQARVFQARELWEKERLARGFSFEDSWVGSKLGGYLEEAGYQDIQVRTYCIRRKAPLAESFATYLQGVAQWFVCEEAPYLAYEDVTAWLHTFMDGKESVLLREGFVYEETEYVVSGVWNSPAARRCFDMHS